MERLYERIPEWTVRVCLAFLVPFALFIGALELIWIALIAYLTVGGSFLLLKRLAKPRSKRRAVEQMKERVYADAFSKEYRNWIGWLLKVAYFVLLGLLIYAYSTPTAIAISQGKLSALVILSALASVVWEVRKEIWILNRLAAPALIRA